MSKNYMHFKQGVVVFLSLLYSTDSIGGNLVHNNETFHGQSTGESSLPLVAKIVGSSLLVLFCLSGVLWLVFRYRRRNR